MDTVQQGVSVQEALGNVANAKPEDFPMFFRRMRKMFPDDVAEACLWLIASRGLDPAGRNMALWLALEGKYLNILLDPDALPMEIATKAATSMKTIDPQFLIRFLKLAETLTPAAPILRALNLVPMLGDYSILVAWLRKISQHSDERVRSRSVKMLCELRPNKGLIERQMLSEEPRVRANAIEALWHAQTPEATALFKSAARDANHRVMANALVGLHLQGDQSARGRMLALCDHPDELFRSAMAWCFGFLLDKNAVPVLKRLSNDTSAMVRKRALQSLLALESEAPEVVEEKIAAVKVEQPEAPKEAAKEEPKKQDDVALPRFLTLR